MQTLSEAEEVTLRTQGVAASVAAELVERAAQLLDAVDLPAAFGDSLRAQVAALRSGAHVYNLAGRE